MKLSATVKEAVADAEISHEEEAEARPCAPRPRTRQDGGADSLTSASGQRTYDHAIRDRCTKSVLSNAVVATLGDALPEPYCFVSTTRPLNVAS